MMVDYQQEEMPLLSLESMVWTCGVYAAAETMLLAILLIDDTQALHHQILVVGDVVAAVARDHRCVGTCLLYTSRCV